MTMAPDPDADTRREQYLEWLRKRPAIKAATVTIKKKAELVRRKGQDG